MTPEERAILDLATEDAYGLWEILPAIAALGPAADLSDVRNRTRRTVQALVSRGWLRVELTAQDQTKEIHPGPELENILADPAFWAAQGTGTEVRVVATEEGEAAYFSLPEESTEPHN